MSVEYLVKEEVLYIFDRGSWTLSRVDGDKKVPITDPDSASWIHLNASQVSREEAIRLTSIKLD